MRKELLFIFTFISAYTIYFIHLPPWWDGITTAVTALDTVTTSINLYADFFGKPPFIFISLGLLFKVFGYSSAIIHLYMLVFSLAGVYFTYKVGELLFDKNAAFAGSLFLAASPLFIAQSLNLNFDLPAMALIMASCYYLLKKDYKMYIPVSTLLVMTKEVGILFIAACVLSEIFNKKKYHILSVQVIPVLVFVTWAFGNYIRRGWFFFPRNSPILQFETIFNDNFFMRFSQLFIMNFNWILTSMVVLSLLIWIVRHHGSIDIQRTRQSLPVVIFSLFFFIVVAPIRDFNLPRYVLVLYPALYLLSGWAIFHLAEKNNKISAAILILLIILFASQTGFSLYSSNPYVFADPATQKIYGERADRTLDGSGIMEINLRYVDYVKADMELVRYLDTVNHSLPLILNRFNHYGISGAANKGIDIGYGQKYPRQYIELVDFFQNPDAISLPAIVVIEDFNRVDLERIYDLYEVTLLKQIKVNGVGVDVYLIDKDY